MNLKRKAFLDTIEKGLSRSRGVVVLGPRQCGKTTLAQELGAKHTDVHYFDLEDPDDSARLSNAKLTLEPLSGVVVIDEVQRSPALFPILRVLMDRNPLSVRFLLLGSASLDLVRMGSESLAGRIEFVIMSGFNLGEVGAAAWRKLWSRGGFPPSYLAASEDDSWGWRKGFVRTFLERDMRAMGVDLPVEQLRRFWLMVSHYHGQIWNASEIGASLQITHPTARRYLDTLAGAFMVRVLPPWHENIKKRQVKSPKIYIRDSGIFHYLQGIRTQAELQAHPKLGASWEGFAMEQVLIGCDEGDAYFWSTHGGAELDLLLLKEGKRIGFEFKYGDAPKLTRSMRESTVSLKLDALHVVYPGEHRFPLADGVDAVPLRNVSDL